jgi:uncharacterized protein Veg
MSPAASPGRKDVVRLAAKKVLADIKRDLDGLIGSRIRLRANKGRRKVDEREGILERTYPSIFVVRLQEDTSSRRISFSYADVLTEAVQLTVCRDDDAEELGRQIAN